MRSLIAEGNIWHSEKQRNTTGFDLKFKRACPISREKKVKPKVRNYYNRIFLKQFRLNVKLQKLHLAILNNKHDGKKIKR